jgi:hypothetical protein
LLLNGVKYVVSGNGWIMPANREDNYFAFCDQYYSYPKRVRPKKRQKEPDCYFTE